MLLRYQFCIAVFLLPFVVNAQTFTGRVLNASDSLPISQISIYVDSAQYCFNWSRADGRFEIVNLTAGKHTIKLQLSTYTDTVFHFTYDPAVDSMFTFYYTVKCKYDQSRTIHNCPICHKQDEVIRIVYGFPGPELLEESKQGKVYLGGCEVFDCQPYWYCKRCKNEF